MANAWKNLVQHLKKDKLLSVSNIIVMFITFLFLGVFISIVVYSQTALKYLEEQAQVTVFFKDEFTEEKILSFKGNMESDKRILEVKYVSKEDALRIFKEMNKDEPILLESITASILPASLEVKAKNLTDLKTLTEEYRQSEGVEEVQFFEDVVHKFSVWSRTVYIIGFILVTAFMIVSYSVVIATLKNSINSRGQELEIMKLVGASDDYVKKPFLHQGVFFGLVSSFVASIVVFILNVVVSKFIPLDKGLSFGFIPGFYVSPVVFGLVLTLIMLMSGFLLGFLGSNTAIKRYLKY